MNAEPFCRLSIPTARLRINWDRQKVLKLQLFLLFPLHWETGGFHAKKVCLSVCLSVCPGQFVSVKPKSGSNILLGVRSEPKTH